MRPRTDGARRNVDALADVWREVAAEARRGGWATVRELIEARYGVVPEDGEGEGEGDGDGDGAREGAGAGMMVPAVEATIERFAERHGLDTIGIEVREGEVSRTWTIAPGMACATYARGVDELATLALALHEAGHAMYRVSLGVGGDPPRWRDEAAAAWAVRGLEDPQVVPDARARAEARRRRRVREAVTARLADFEARVIAGEAVREAWPEGLDPAAYPALFEEPGVMAAYAAADRWPQRIVPRKVRA